MPSFFDTFDEDKLLQQVLPRVFKALESWKRGMAADETALMNQVTSVFNTEKARNCEIGLNEEFHVKTDLYELHRRGDNQKDRYGSDLGITISSASNPAFTKTAFVQFKISKDGTARIENSQIADAKVLQEVYDRAFVIAVDPNRKVLRTKAVNEISTTASQQTTGCSLDDWEGFAEWLVNWLRCKRGVESDDSQMRSIERLLQDLSITDSELDLRGEWDLPPEYLPTKSWLRATFKPKKG